jgi:hypothetical protein
MADDTSSSSSSRCATHQPTATAAAKAASLRTHRAHPLWLCVCAVCGLLAARRFRHCHRWSSSIRLSRRSPSGATTPTSDSRRERRDAGRTRGAVCAQCSCARSLLHLPLVSCLQVLEQEEERWRHWRGGRCGQLPREHQGDGHVQNGQTHKHMRNTMALMLPLVAGICAAAALRCCCVARLRSPVVPSLPCCRTVSFSAMGDTAAAMGDFMRHERRATGPALLVARTGNALSPCAESAHAIVVSRLLSRPERSFFVIFARSLLVWPLLPSVTRCCSTPSGRFSFAAGGGVLERLLSPDASQRSAHEHQLPSLPRGHCTDGQSTD